MESNPFGSFGFKGIVATRQVRTDRGPRQTYLPSTGIAFEHSSVGAISQPTSA